MDLHELYTEQEAAAIAAIYDMDKRDGAFPTIAQCRIDRTAIIGKRSAVWDFARVLAYATIGDDCSIGGGTEIGRGCNIGNRTRIGANCFLPPNTVVGESVFIGPGVIMTDDKFPRISNEGDPPYKAEPPVIEDNAVIGAAVVILPGVRIGAGAFICAGAVVTKDVPANASVIGFPARVRVA